MRVLISGKWFDSGEVPIVLELCDLEREQIADMPPGDAGRFMKYDAAKLSEDEAGQIIRTGR